MTENFWQKFKKKKEENKNEFFDEVESELKRKFKREKSPDELMLQCKTDNNYWKQYRMSEYLDDDAVAMVLCKNIGCELMYCQALTFSKEAQLKNIETYGCEDQYNTWRNCYLKEKRKFNSLHKPNQWKEDGEIIPRYLKEQLKIQKETREKEIAVESSEKASKESSEVIQQRIQEQYGITIGEEKKMSYNDRRRFGDVK